MKEKAREASSFPWLRRQRGTPILGLSALIGLVIAALPALASAAPVLERVVLVSRHGVRSPTQTVEALDAATGQTWPAWPVGPGELTPHGAKALGRMGDFLHAVYAGEGLLPAQGCAAAGTVQVWADGADSRTERSGDILATALAPGCGVAAAHGPDGARDPVFDAVDTGVCPIDAGDARPWTPSRPSLRPRAARTDAARASAASTPLRPARPA
jgi:4-phytase/acid phosphatase